MLFEQKIYHLCENPPQLRYTHLNCVTTVLMFAGWQLSSLGGSFLNSFNLSLPTNEVKVNTFLSESLIENETPQLFILSASILTIGPCRISLLCLPFL